MAAKKEKKFVLKPGSIHIKIPNQTAETAAEYKLRKEKQGPQLRDTTSTARAMKRT